MSMRSSTAESPPSALLPPRAALATLLDAVDDPLLLFDDLGRLSFGNRAAMRALGAEPGLGVAQLQPVLGTEAVEWLSARLAQAGDAAAPLRVALADGRAARLSCWRIARDVALRVLIEAAEPAAPAALPEVEAGPTLEMLRMLWASPFPATLQDAQFRLVAVNDAYLQFTGRTREALIGTDPVLLQPLEDQAGHIEARRELPAQLAAQAVPRLSEQRLIDASGRERWSRASAYPVLAQDGLPLLLCVLQDSTAEHVARAQADRSLDELAQWFDLSP
ncbi:MAG: PAS domain-containing protein, partial [Burkholderiaceae bacterium]|nr:PAS domain-containing protein [Burkholderiaceae bacterium]